MEFGFKVFHRRRPAAAKLASPKLVRWNNQCPEQPVSCWKMSADEGRPRSGDINNGQRHDHTVIMFTIKHNAYTHVNPHTAIVISERRDKIEQLW